ncbi:MAG: DUF192 domain-containing protein [Acidobacteria bacterium]|nr:DUF192 domain-containing protein [Acidobacteriota bacterium]
MPWLVRDGEVLASLETAAGRRARRRGLLGRDELDGVLRLRARSVHTFGMRVPIDVAFCVPRRDGSLEVAGVVTLRPRRVSRPRWRARVALEAEEGAFRSWGVGRGDRLEVR